MASKDELDIAFYRNEGIKYGDGCTSRISEDVFDSEVVDGFDEGLCAVD